MKILHICTGWPLSYKGGITNYVRSIAYAQYKNGHEVSVLGREDKVKYPFTYINYTSNRITPFTYMPLVDKKGLNWINKLLDEENFDIIHIHALEYVDWDIYQILKGRHYVVSLHDYCFICPRIYMFTPKQTVCEKYDEDKCNRCFSYLDRYKVFRGGIRKINKIFHTKLSVPYIPQNIASTRYEKFRELLNGADYILPVSKKVEEIYKASGIAAKSKVLHIGNDSADEFKEDFQYDLNPHTFKIVFLGRLSEYKGVDLFFNIAKHYKASTSVQFYFLGRSGEYADKLKECGIIDRGSYNPQQLSSLLQEYDLGMVLSIWHDNGPQVVMELLNNHVPVIGTKMGGIPDFVNNSNGFIFNPYDSSDISKLYSFIDNLTPEKIFQLKKNIHRTVTPQEHYDELMKVYNDVLSRTQ